MLCIISKLADGAHDKVDVFEERVEGESCQADGQCGKGPGVQLSKYRRKAARTYATSTSPSTVSSRLTACG